MASLFAVIAKTVTHETVLDSLWDSDRAANMRANDIWEYPDVFRAEVQSYEINKIDIDNLNYELTKDDDYIEDEW